MMFKLSTEMQMGKLFETLCHGALVCRVMNTVAQ